MRKILISNIVIFIYCLKISFIKVFSMPQSRGYSSLFLCLLRLKILVSFTCLIMKFHNQNISLFVSNWSKYILLKKKRFIDHCALQEVRIATSFRPKNALGIQAIVESFPSKHTTCSTKLCKHYYYFIRIVKENLNYRS